jgi:hypothetical protein
MPWAPASSSKVGSKKNPAAPLAPSATWRVRPPPHLRQHGLRPPSALRRKYGVGRWGEKKTHALIFWQASKCRASKLAFPKARLNFLAALASGFLCSEAPCVWFRGLRRLGLPPAALVFRLRLRLFGSKFICACLLFVRLWRSYFQCANNARFTSFGTSSEAKFKQHAAVYLISICCSAKGCKDQLLLLANSLVCCLFNYCRLAALSFGQAAIASCSRYRCGWSRRWCGHTQLGASRCRYL